MKTFLLNIPNDIRNWNKAMDAQSILCKQAWNVFNNDGIKEVYIFQKDGTLIASHNGKVTKARWEYIAQNSSIIIENLDNEAYLLVPTYYDNKILALQVDGTNNYAIMINESYIQHLMIDSISKVRLYIEEKHKNKEQENTVLLAHKNNKEEWERFINRKTQEYYNSPQMKEKLKKQEKEKKYFGTFGILTLIIVLFKLLSAQETIMSIVLTIIMLIDVIYIVYIYGFYGDNENSIKSKIIDNYPFHSFNR